MDDNPKKNFWWALLSQAYIQLASVLGALSIASLLSHFRFVDWKPVILEWLSWWSAIARPLVDTVYAPILSVLGYVVGFEISVPVEVKDYLGVGVVLILSRLRGSTGGWAGGATRAVSSIYRNFWRALGLLLRTLLLWPIEFIFLLRNLLFASALFPDRTPEDIRNIRLSHFLALLPAFYSILLVLANWFVVPMLVVKALTVSVPPARAVRKSISRFRRPK